MASWVYDPHSGGMKIPTRLKEPIKQRILAYAAEHYAGKYNRIDVRFRDKFCYIDGFIQRPVEIAEIFMARGFECVTS